MHDLVVSLECYQIYIYIYVIPLLKSNWKPSQAFAEMEFMSIGDPYYEPTIVVHD